MKVKKVIPNLLGFSQIETLLGTPLPVKPPSEKGRRSSYSSCTGLKRFLRVLSAFRPLMRSSTAEMFLEYLLKAAKICNQMHSIKQTSKPPTTHHHKQQQQLERASRAAAMALVQRLLHCFFRVTFRVQGLGSFFLPSRHLSSLVRYAGRGTLHRRHGWTRFGLWS